MRLRALAPGKVNLCLFLGGDRHDGRHELVTRDRVGVARGRARADRHARRPDDEVVCPGVEGPNLVARALAGLRARGWDAPPVRIEIDKRIPVAAGMGGGSADAAAALRLASRLAPVAEERASSSRPSSAPTCRASSRRGSRSGPAPARSSSHLRRSRRTRS